MCNSSGINTELTLCMIHCEKKRYKPLPCLSNQDSKRAANRCACRVFPFFMRCLARVPTARHACPWIRFMVRAPWCSPFFPKQMLSIAVKKACPAQINTSRCQWLWEECGGVGAWGLGALGKGGWSISLQREERMLSVDLQFSDCGITLKTIERRQDGGGWRGLC